MTNNADNRGRISRLGIRYLLILASLPFWAGAGAAINGAFSIPDSRGIIAKANICEAAVFLLGMAVGISSAGIALGSVKRRHREYGAAGVIMGISLIFLARTMSWSLDQSSIGANMALPFLIPTILAFISLMLFVSAMRIDEKPKELKSEPVQSPEEIKMP